MYQHILLALDGSALSRSAVPHAAQVAAPGATVDVIQVIPTRETLRRELQSTSYEFTMGGERSIEDLVESTHFARHDDAQATLAAAQEELARAGVTTVHTEVREGFPGNEILDAAAEHADEVIVMATRGHSGLGREVLGSVAEYVLRHAGASTVLLAGPRAAPPAGSPAGPPAGGAR